MRNIYLIPTIMVPFSETANSKEELVELAKKGFQDFTNRIISKNDFCMFFGFTHGEAITKYYKGNYGQLLLDAGFNSGSEAYFSGGINAWINLKAGKYIFPPIQNEGRKITKLLDPPLQTIFYGAPGTGKSHKVKEVTDELPKSDVFRTTFHPDSDYSTFVGCYKPKMVKAPIRDGSGHEITSACEDEKKRIAYEYEPQAFLKAYLRAYETSEPVFLVIEEINRGNCAQIFGDMFQLLDRNENGESDYAIKPETAIQEFLNEKLKDCDIEDDTIKSGEEMRLPANLHIWATMNTSDQSLFPIDSAFKRRWDWKYMPIDYDKEAWSIVAKGEQYSWSDFLKKMNNLVASATDSEDKMLGFYFAKAKKGIIDADTFVGKVVFYLWNDVFKDYGLPKEILNGVESKEFAFRNFFMVDGRANEDMVKRLLDNLGVAKPVETGSPVEDTEHQDEA